MNIEQRIESLEKDLDRVRSRNRWLVAALLLLGAGAVAGLGRASEVENEVRARTFYVVDENGKISATLASTKNGPVLWMLDKDGHTRVELEVRKQGPGLWLNDETGVSRARLVADKDDGTDLSLFDEKLTVRARLKFKDGPALSLFDKDEEVRATLVTGKDGYSALAMFDENGTIRARMRLLKDGPALLLNDENGKDVWKAP